MRTGEGICLARDSAVSQKLVSFSSSINELVNLVGESGTVSEGVYVLLELVFEMSSVSVPTLGLHLTPPGWPAT